MAITHASCCSTAAARRQPRDALGHARATLAHASAFGGPLGGSHDQVRLGWPLAARTADDLGVADATNELLTMLDSHPPEYLPPMLKAERALVRARLSARDGDPAAAASLTAAVRGLRELSNPYHLAPACSTAPAISPAWAMAAPPRPPPGKPAISPVTCAASRCWTGPRTSRRRNPRYRLPYPENPPTRPGSIRPQRPDYSGAGHVQNDPYAWATTVKRANRKPYLTGKSPPRKWARGSGPGPAAVIGPGQGRYWVMRP